MDKDYLTRVVVKETQKAYLVEQSFNNPRDGAGVNFKWVAKSQCKNYKDVGFGIICVDVPVWLVGNGIWGH